MAEANRSDSQGHSLHVVVLSSSPSEHSRSRVAAHFVMKRLAFLGATVDLIDLKDEPVALYPEHIDDPQCQALVDRFRRADGWVLATPVYNWAAASSMMNFLHFALSGEQRRYRPFLVVSGAGSEGSLLALDGLCRSFIHEVHAVQIGPPIMVAGEEADYKTGGLLSPQLQRRLEVVAGNLLRFAATALQLNYIAEAESTAD